VAAFHHGYCELGHDLIDTDPEPRIILADIAHAFADALPLYAPELGQTVEGFLTGNGLAGASQAVAR
jgi:hypothetical protein